jgi:hypothetical protein
MLIYHREPVFTIGRAPFVAGAIYVRNQVRVLKQRERARKWQAFVERVRSRAGTLLRRLMVRRTLTSTSSSAAAHA